MCMRAMYQKCKLVHGDLSEYNMLHFRGTLYIIDVSQVCVVPHTHTHTPPPKQVNGNE